QDVAQNKKPRNITQSNQQQNRTIPRHLTHGSSQTKNYPKKCGTISHAGAAVVAAWPHPSIELAKGRAFRFIGQSGKSAAKSRLEAAEESIEFVGGVEVGLELAGG